MLEADGPDVEAELTTFVVQMEHFIQLPLDAVYADALRRSHSHHPISLSAGMTSGALRIVTMMMLVIRVSLCRGFAA